MLDHSEVPATHNCPAPALAPFPVRSTNAVTNVSCFGSWPSVGLPDWPVSQSHTLRNAHTWRTHSFRAMGPPVACFLSSWFVTLSSWHPQGFPEQCANWYCPLTHLSLASSGALLREEKHLPNICQSSAAKLADTSKSTPASSSPSPVYPHSSLAPPAALVFPTIPSEAATSLRHARKADTTKPHYLTFKAILPVGSYQTQLFWARQQKQSEATALPGL